MSCYRLHTLQIPARYMLSGLWSTGLNLQQGLPQVYTMQSSLGQCQAEPITKTQHQCAWHGHSDGS